MSGHLDTFAEKFAIERALRRVKGVKAIALELDVKLSPQHLHNDTEIASAIEQALQWHAPVPPEKIRVTVEAGWVTLQGEVDWDFERQAVYKAIRPLAGVVGISNEITLRARATPANVERQIEQALTRQAIREAKRIQIDVDGPTVTLRGQVHSWQESDAAAGAAWSTPGIRSVINELHVASGPRSRREIR